MFTLAGSIFRQRLPIRTLAAIIMTTPWILEGVEIFTYNSCRYRFSNSQLPQLCPPFVIKLVRSSFPIVHKSIFSIREFFLFLLLDYPPGEGDLKRRREDVGR